LTDSSPDAGKSQENPAGTFTQPDDNQTGSNIPAAGLESPDTPPRDPDKL